MTSPLSHADAELLKAELERRIEGCRYSLEHPQQDTWANLIRGEIRGLRSLLTWLDPAAEALPPAEPAERRLSEPPDY